MTDRSSNLVDNVTPTTTLPVRIPGATLGPRPAFPAQAATVRHLSHDLPSMPAYDDAWGRPSAWAAFGEAS